MDTESLTTVPMVGGVGVGLTGAAAMAGSGGVAERNGGVFPNSSSSSSSSCVPPNSLPAARRCWNGGGPFSHNNNEAAGSCSSGLPALPTASGGSLLQQQRKRPGCQQCCIHHHPGEQDDDEAAQQPLDLSLPKFKVRQHWSGGSIVHESAATVNVVNLVGSQQCGCPPLLPSTLSSNSAASFNVSVTVQTPQRWLLDPQQLQLQPCHPPEQLRLRIDIPSNSGSQSTPGSHQPPLRIHHRFRKASNSAEVMEQQQPLQQVSTADDDLQRLGDSQHQLRQCGFYYGHLSWKESAQLLQNTPNGTFLVRDSSDDRFLYALSLQTDRGPTSVRIHYSSGGFRLDTAPGPNGLVDHLPRFRTVLDLVDHYVAKWSQCRQKGQVWLDNNGQVHSEVVLIRPLIKSCPSLQHLCRLAWNNRHQTAPLLRKPSSSSSVSSAAISRGLPSGIQSYLNEYPFRH